MLVIRRYSLREQSVIACDLLQGPIEPRQLVAEHETVVLADADGQS